MEYSGISQRTRQYSLRKLSSRKIILTHWIHWKMFCFLLSTFFNKMKLLGVITAFAVLQLCKGQAGLQTFEEAKVTLERGGLITANLEYTACESSFPFPEDGNQFMNVAFREWTFTQNTEDTYIRGNDYYIRPSANGEEMLSTVREIFLRPDNSVKFSFRQYNAGNNGTVRSFNVFCTLGVSAKLYEFQSTTAIDHYFSYGEVKSYLLLGKYLDAVVFLEACENADAVLPQGARQHFGHRIDNFAVFNEGTNEEILVFYHTNLFPGISDPEASSAWFNYQYTLFKNGTATVQNGVYEFPDFGTDLWTHPDYVCDIGTAMQFSSYREKDNSYVTYAAVKEATLQGHEIELITFYQLCTVVEGPAPPNAIVGHRFDKFTWFKSGTAWGQESLSFSTFAYNPEGIGIFDEVRAMTDNSVLFSWHRRAPTSEVMDGVVTCPLQSSALFHSVSRDRLPTNTYAGLSAAIKNEGAIFEVEVDVDKCSSDGLTLDAQVLFGGVVWAMYVIEGSSEGDLLEGAFFQKLANILNPTVDVPTWTSAVFSVTPDNTVDFFISSYDASGNVLPDTIYTFQCRINNGGPEGGVYFYRYP